MGTPAGHSAGSSSPPAAARATAVAGEARLGRRGRGGRAATAIRPTPISMAEIGRLPTASIRETRPSVQRRSRGDEDRQRDQRHDRGRQQHPRPGPRWTGLVAGGGDAELQRSQSLEFGIAPRRTLGEVAPAFMAVFEELAKGVVGGGSAFQATRFGPRGGAGSRSTPHGLNVACRWKVSTILARGRWASRRPPISPGDGGYADPSRFPPPSCPTTP